MSWSSKAANNGKLMRIQEPDCTIDRSARVGVKTCVLDAVLEKMNYANKKNYQEGKTHQQQPQSNQQNVVTKRCDFRAKNLPIEVPRIIKRGSCQSIPET